MKSMNQGLNDHAWVFPMADRWQDPTIDGGNNSEDQESTDTDKADDQPRRELVLHYYL